MSALRLLEAVQSTQFWNMTGQQLCQLKFSILSYSNGIGVIDVDYSQTQIAPVEIMKQIRFRGGIVISIGNLNAVFSLSYQV